MSDGVLETRQAEPFVPAAATFQSATDIYTPALIERLACEPSACTQAPASTHTHTHRPLSLFSALRLQTQTALTHSRERPDVLHLCPPPPPSQKAKKSRGGRTAEVFLPRVEFGIHVWILTLTFQHLIWPLRFNYRTESDSSGLKKKNTAKNNIQK